MSFRTVTTHQALKCLGSMQQARWHRLLRDIDEASSQREMDHAKYRAEGYLLGLFDAHVFDEAERVALLEEALTREQTSTLFDA